MDRRKFLLNTAVVSAGTLLAACEKSQPQVAVVEEAASFDTWEGIRKQFRLASGRIHMTQMLLASHPKPVRDAIEKHRDALDANPVDYWENSVEALDNSTRKQAAAYMGVTPEEIALTDSTSMGLAMMYSGMKLKPGQEVLTTTHDHYATEKALEFASARNGALVKRVSLYEDPSNASIDTMVGVLKNAITPKTKLIAITFVHSVTGVKTPIREIASMVKEANGSRAVADRIYFCVDGVHGFGIENINVADIGCDFFAAGTHKWIFGPRGTGVLYARKDAWDMIAPIIPAFEFDPYDAWMGVQEERAFGFKDLCTPGGFHSFEHRWALADAFGWQLTIGKARIEERSHFLSKQLKEGMKSITHIKLLTPRDESVSAGINCFMVDGMEPEKVVKRLLDRNITASVTPYKTRYARLTPSIVNTEEEVSTVLKELEQVRG